MSVRLSEAATNDTIYNSVDHREGIFSSDISEFRYGLNHPCINATFDELSFEGISIRHGRVVLKEDIEIVEEGAAPVMAMYFNLSGNSHTRLHEAGYDLKFSERQHNMIYIPSFKARFKAAAHSVVPNEKLEIYLAEDYFSRIMPGDNHRLARFAENVALKKTAILGQDHVHAAKQVNSLIFQILNTPKTGAMKRLFLESRILELLMVQLETFLGYTGVKNDRISNSDIEKLHYAKTLVEKNITNPYSLTELSRETGLNDFKLKKGFKLLFGKTVFGYLHEMRMQRARELLLESTLSMQEVSEYCGYAFIAHFVTAFKKTHGVTPGKLRSR